MAHQTIRVETALILLNQKNTSELSFATLRYASIPTAVVSATQAYGTPNRSNRKIFGALPSRAEAYRTRVDE